MTVTFKLGGQPYSAEVDGGQVVMLRLLRPVPGGQYAEVEHWEYPERLAGAVSEARKVAGLDSNATGATAAAPDGSASSGAAYTERTRRRGQRL